MHVDAPRTCCITVLPRGRGRCTKKVVGSRRGRGELFRPIYDSMERLYSPLIRSILDIVRYKFFSLRKYVVKVPRFGINFSPQSDKIISS